MCDMLKRKVVVEDMMYRMEEEIVFMLDGKEIKEFIIDIIGLKFGHHPSVQNLVKLIEVSPILDEEGNITDNYHENLDSDWFILER